MNDRDLERENSQLKKELNNMKLRNEPSGADPNRIFRRDGMKCFGCGRTGHILRDCRFPKKPENLMGESRTWAPNNRRNQESFRDMNQKWKEGDRDKRVQFEKSSFINALTIVKDGKEVLEFDEDLQIPIKINDIRFRAMLD